MTYYIRFFRAIAMTWLLMVVASQSYAQGAVDPIVRSFIKRCDVFVNEKTKKDTGAQLTQERRKLAAQKVPITLDLEDCKNTHYKIRLKNGAFAQLPFGYPTNADPDYKGDRHVWVPDGPSDQYWRFDFYGWEWGGWLLVDKRTGRKIETTTECVDGQIYLAINYIATVCSGTYENQVDTLFVADINSDPVRWSKGIQQGLCPKDERFSLVEFQSQKSGTFAIEYECDSGSKGKASFKVDDSGLKSRIRGVNRLWEWDQ